MAGKLIPQKQSYLSVRDVAQRFNVCEKTVRRWITQKILPATRIGRDWRIDIVDLKSITEKRSNRNFGNGF